MQIQFTRWHWCVAFFTSYVLSNCHKLLNTRLHKHLHNLDYTAKFMDAYIEKVLSGLFIALNFKLIWSNIHTYGFVLYVWRSNSTAKSKIIRNVVATKNGRRRTFRCSQNKILLSLVSLKMCYMSNSRRSHLQILVQGNVKLGKRLREN